MKERAAALAQALAVAVVLAAPATALAHGRESSLGQIAFHPTDRLHIVVRASFGLLTSRDGGETWTWQCAAALPFDRTREDPAIAMMPSHALLAGTFDGLVRSDDAACAWSVPPSAPGGAYVTDVLRDPTDPIVAWAIVSPGATPDVIHRSVDQGQVWTPVAMPHPSALTDRIRIAPSDAQRVYTSGVVPRADPEPRVGMLLRSDDRGETFRALPIALVEEERTAHVLAVDPTDADRLWVRTVRRVTDTVPERIVLSEDGGETWRTVLEALEVVGFAISDDGQTVWAGSWDGGLYRSTDAGRTFETLDPALRVRCLAWRAGEAASDPSELWVCADGFGRGYALGRSIDLGATIEPLWYFEDVVNDVGCPADTQVGALCPMYWPDLAFDLQLDGAVSPGADGGVPMDGGAEETPPGSCACAAAGAYGASRGPLGLALLLALVANVRRSRRNVRRRAAPQGI